MGFDDKFQSRSIRGETDDLSKSSNPIFTKYRLKSLKDFLFQTNHYMLKSLEIPKILRIS